MTSKDEELELTYGPAAQFSEHKRGESITYRTANGQGITSGTIIWVCAAGMVGDRHMALHYVVAPDEPTGFIDVAFPDDVVVTDSDQARNSKRPGSPAFIPDRWEQSARPALLSVMVATLLRGRRSGPAT